MQRLVESEKLEVLSPEYGTKPRVYYRNLYRFTRCFIAGSVAVDLDGKMECADGAEVILTRVSNKKIQEARTDNYGDFKFDDLEENSGKYSLEILYKGYEKKTLEMTLSTSINMGTIFL
jgi:hypothetical protein